jgi:hypothetical protein
MRLWEVTRCACGRPSTAGCPRPTTGRARTHARRRGGDALERLARGEWPAASVVSRLFGSWSGAPVVATPRAGEMQPSESAAASSSFARDSISLPKPRESAAISVDLRGGEEKLQQVICRAFPSAGSISPIIRVGEVPGSNPGAPIKIRYLQGIYGGWLGSGIESTARDQGPVPR